MALILELAVRLVGCLWRWNGVAGAEYSCECCATLPSNATSNANGTVIVQLLALQATTAFGLAAQA